MKTCLPIVPWLFLAGLGGACTGATPPPVPGVLFSLSVWSDELTELDPIATLHAGELRDPSLEEGGTLAAAFAREYYRPGRAYPVYSGGERVATAVVVGVEEPVCTGLPARAMLTGGGSLRRGLATDEPVELRRSTGRPATDAEIGSVRPLVAELWRARDLPEALTTGVEPLSTLTFAVPGGPRVLAATYRVDLDPELGNAASLLLIAEDRHGVYRPAFEWFHRSEGEVDVVVAELLDVLDLGRDGDPDLVIRSTYYESWDYRILSRTAGAWAERYRGGGGGC
jgi:hypothetical protein